MPNSRTMSTTNKYIEAATKILAAAVIPIFLWGVKLEVENAVRDEQITQLEEEIENLENIDSTVQAYAIKLSQVDQKLEQMDITVKEIRLDIKDLLRRDP